MYYTNIFSRNATKSECLVYFKAKYDLLDGKYLRYYYIMYTFKHISQALNLQKNKQKKTQMSISINALVLFYFGHGVFYPAAKDRHSFIHKEHKCIII